MHAQRVRLEGHVNTEQQVRDEQRPRERRRDEPRDRESRQQRERAQPIDHVVDVVAVLRTLTITHACQSSVQAVAEPVREQTEIHSEHGPFRLRNEAIRNAGEHERDRPQRRQVIGRDPSGQAPSDRAEEAPLRFGREAAQISFHRFDPRGKCGDAELRSGPRSSFAPRSSSRVGEWVPPVPKALRNLDKELPNDRSSRR
jgi:hypothetical protein